MKFTIAAAVAALATLSVASPAPAPEAAPIGAPVERQATPPLVESNKLRRVLLRSELLAKARILEGFAYSTPGRNRQIFTPGHKATYEYIYKFMSDLGYDVEYNEFFAETSSGSLVVDGTNIPARPMTFTPSGKPSGRLVKVNNIGCEASDYPAEVSGAVALILRGTCPFAQKAKLAGQAGAVGTVIYNNAAGPLDGTLGASDPDFVPTVGISDTAGASLVSQLATASKTASLDVLVTELPTYNVIAETKGGDHDNVLLVGAHTDSVNAGPGINDNGSGTIALLEIAKQLTAFSTNNAVRFGFWSAEEVGLVGSTEYANGLSEEELAKITLYLNFDMLASPNYIYAVYDGDGSAFNISGPPGSAAAEKLFEDYFKNDVGLATVPTAFDSRSDYAAFAARGVPVGGLFTGAEKLKTPEEAALFGGKVGVAYDINYHGAGDNVANVNVGAWIQNTKAIAHAVATYGLSFASLGLGKRYLQERSDWVQEVPTAVDLAHSHISGGGGHEKAEI